MTWRTIPHDLRSGGKPQTLRQLGARRDDMAAATKLGLVRRLDGWPARYELTQIGSEWLDGRIEVRHLWPCQYVVRATWLKALPQGLRIA